MSLRYVSQARDPCLYLVARHARIKSTRKGARCWATITHKTTSFCHASKTHGLEDLLTARPPRIDAASAAIRLRDFTACYPPPWYSTCSGRILPRCLFSRGCQTGKTLRAWR
eukprot:scaffold73319_cov72-Phaeocystis_antarctica.AAC.3